MTEGINFRYRLSVLLLLVLNGCAAQPGSQVLPPAQAIPALKGSYHRVRPGETVWRIAHAYGLSVDALTAANRLSNASQLDAGQQLFIPLPKESMEFFWPVVGPTATSSRGVDIAAPPGTLVRASRTGRVVVATRQLSAWGKTVVLDHGDGYTTIYAALSQVLVLPGNAVRQGTPVGSLDARPLHFEIRHGITTKNPLAMLPGD